MKVMSDTFPDVGGSHISMLVGIDEEQFRSRRSLMLKYSYDPSGNMVVRMQDNLLAPQIAGQPVKQIAAPGDLASFSVVVADARAVTFQWKFNGTDIPGATGDSLLLTNITK